MQEELYHTLGEFPLLGQRRSPTAPTGRIGIIIHNFDSPFYGPIVDGAARLVHHYGYTTVVHASGGSVAGEQHSWEALIRSRCDGIICYSISQPQDKLREVMCELPQSVVINRRVKGLESRCICLDNVGGARLAARHLLANCHTKIAMLTGPKEYPEAAQRSTGFIDELNRQGVNIDDELIIDGGFTLDKGAMAFRRLLDTDRPFSAVFCQNDEIAAGVVDVCNREFISVPNDLSIIGFDDIKIANITTPRLTTIRQPIAGSGALAARILLGLIEGKTDNSTSTEEHRELIPELIVRDSVVNLRSRSGGASSTLTPREIECLQWIAGGKTSAEIAIILSLSEHTVNFHLKNVIYKLKASNRTHAVALALSNKQIKPL